jgi:hypothetical protein
VRLFGGSILYSWGTEQIYSLVMPNASAYASVKMY